MIIIMKLVSTLTYFIKNQQEILFRRQRKQLKSGTQLMSGKSPNDKSNKNELRLNVPNMQMQINVKNSSFFGKREAKQVPTQANKEMFSKQSQQFSHNRLANNEKIIKQIPKKNIQVNHLYQIIKVIQLPMQLFNIHNKFCKQFTPGNYEHLFMKLHFSINNQDTILRYMQQKKNKMNQQSKAQIKAAHLEEKEIVFLSKQQMINHQEWKNLIQEIINKFQKINDIKALNQYLRPILTIQRAFSFTPAQLYQYILAKNATANFEDLSTNNISSIIHLLKYKNRIKQSNDKQSDEIENSEEETVSINHFIAKIVGQIINNPQKYSKTQFIDVFIVVNRRKMRANVLNEQLLTKSEKSIMAYLKNYTFHNIYTYIKIYAYFHPIPNIPLLNTLIVSLSKKCNQKDNNNFLLMFLHNTKQRKLIVQKSTGESISLEANSISTQIATVLSNRIDELKPIEVKYFLDYCFNNQIKDVNKIIYKQISLEISRKCKILSLQILAKGLFKLHLLGCRQKMLANNVSQQFIRRYHQQMQSLKEDDGFSPPQTINMQQKSLNLKQIHLQQCLIMVIWTLLKNHKDNTVQSEDFKKLLKVCPTKVTSMDPLIIQLIENINYIRQKQSKIMYQFQPGIFPEGRLSQFYTQNFSKNEIQRLMWQEAQLTNQFMANYNIKNKRFLPERWSSVSTYKIKDYRQFCLQSSNYKICFFEENITLSDFFLQKRIEKISIYGKDSRNSSKYQQNHQNLRENFV